ncbi:MAG: DsbC family protein [Pseudomonadota bacterium]
MPHRRRFLFSRDRARADRLFCRCICTLLSALLAATAVPAQEPPESVLAAVRHLVPNATEVRVYDSPIDGLYEVLVGMRVLYVSDDGRHILAGALVDVVAGRNRTDERLAEARRARLNDRTTLEPLRWPATEERHTITVVTDIDCPYCRRLHKTVPAFNAAGISVEYLMLPRSGPDTPSWQKTVSALCEADAEAAVTRAMQGESMPERECDDRVRRHWRFARDIDVGSTPTIILPDGRLLLGQRSPEDVTNAIENQSAP